MRTMILAFLLAWIPASVLRAQDAAEAPVGLTIVGYDVESNAVAQKQFADMSKAVEDSGGKSRVLTAGVDEEQLKNAMTEAVSETAAPVPQEPELVLSAMECRPRERVAVVIQNPPPEPRAWIGFYKADAPADQYVSYTALNNLTEGTYDVTAPGEPGLYNFRLFRDESYEAIATSEAVSVVP